MDIFNRQLGTGPGRDWKQRNTPGSQCSDDFLNCMAISGSVLTEKLELMG